MDDLVGLLGALYCPYCGALMPGRVALLSPQGVRSTYTGCVKCEKRFLRLLEVRRVLDGPALAAAEGG